MYDDMPHVRRALVVVHESPIGPVARVGAAVAAGLRSQRLHADLAGPDEEIDWAALDLLVIGCPATALASRRERAAGLQHWLASLPQGRAAGPWLATYETRVGRRGQRRGAAGRAAVGLWSRGWRVASAPASFFLSEGAVGPAELARAARWGHDLAGRDQRHGPLDDRPAVLAGADVAVTAQLAGALA